MYPADRVMASGSALATEYVAPIRRESANAEVIHLGRPDLSRRFLPSSMTCEHELDFLSAASRLRLNHIQGRSYLNFCRLGECFNIEKARVLAARESKCRHAVTRVLNRCQRDSLRQLRAFRQAERLLDEHMPRGYRFVADAEALGAVIRQQPPWAITAFCCHLELNAVAGRDQCRDAREPLCPLVRRVTCEHAGTARRQALVDTLEWEQAGAELDADGLARAVDGLIDLIDMLDTLVAAQAASDSLYFFAQLQEPYGEARRARVADVFARAYRAQFVQNALFDPEYRRLLRTRLTPTHARRVASALR